MPRTIVRIDEKLKRELEKRALTTLESYKAILGEYPAKIEIDKGYINFCYLNGATIQAKIRDLEDGYEIVKILTKYVPKE